MLRIITVFLISLVFSVANASHEANTEEKKKFNPSEMITHHIADSHEWHLWGESAIYLPIILKTDKGVEVFSSSHLYHNEKQIEVNGEHKHYYVHERGDLWCRK